MADRIRWGILATGSIARQFARGLKVSRTGTLQAVGSRSQESADRFCAEHGGRGYASYDAVLADPEVDAVYIATPHHLHAENTISAARAGKAILCEKPFTLNALEAERALAAVREAGVFFMEAFMYRCHPQTLKIRELLAAGAIGEVRQVNAEFGFHAGEDWQNFRADGAVGGGGLMDVGSYCVSFARMAMGDEPVRHAYAIDLTARGYDASGSGMLAFSGGRTAHFGCAVHLNLRNDARIYGTQGSIHVDVPWKCSGGKLTLARNGGESESWEMGVDNDHLYGIEADAVAQYLEAKECPHMTLADTLGNMRALDALRQSASLKFAAEPTA